MVLWTLLIATFLLIGTWVGGYFLAWPLWLKIVLTVVIVLGVVFVFALRRIRAVLRARRLERDILKQAEEQVQNARPDRRGDILELQRQIQRGISSLKTSRLGQAGGASALYSLPWYIIIGPPGAGKTTALKHSGLAFPVLDQNGGGIRGVGGTRNCDWWFTNEGILLDTAGRYATEDDDLEPWLAFLGFLKKYRPRKPVNGVLVAVSVTEIMNAKEEEIEALGRRLRTRVDEVMTRLKMVVPVYVVFTKMDLVAGFVEFWNDLRKSERSQVWGVTFPLAGPSQEGAAKRFEGEFDDLAQTLHARAVRTVNGERQPEARRSIFHFPLEFQSLRDPLSDFVSALFQPNAFQETPILRGVYFTSGTQEGSPVDRVVGGMLRAFNIAGGTTGAAVAGRVEPKSYFVTDLFRRIVFPDKDFAARTKGELRRQFLNRLAFAIAALALAVLVAMPSSCSYAKNSELLSQTDTVAAEASKTPWSDPNVSVADKAKHLDDIRDKLKELDDWKENSPPIGYRWGMYVGEDIHVPLRGVYVGNLQIGFATPTKAHLEEELRVSSGAATLTTDQYNVLFNRLKAYLEACDVDRLEPEWESNAMTDAWARTLGAPTKPEKDILRNHVSYYFDLMKRKEIPVWTCDVNLMNRSRSFLKRLSGADRDYSALLRDADENVVPVTRDSIFLNTEFGTYVTSKSNPEVFVSGAFTKEGWDLYVRDRLGKDRAKQLATERWVLGETTIASEKETDRQLKELRDRYFSSYTRAWADFLHDLEIRKPANNDEALDELNALSEVPWPYLRLLRKLDENVHLEEAVGEQAEREIQRRAEAELLRNNALGRILGDAGVIDPPPTRWISPPELAFSPMTKFGVPTPGPGQKNDPNALAAAVTQTQLAHYQDRIVSKLVAVLTDLRDSKGRGVEPKKVTEAFEEAIRGTNELMTPTQSGFTRPVLSPLLLNPIELSYAGTLNDLSGTNGGNWETDVWSKWHAKLEDGYPFTDTWKDVKLSDFTEFFKPGDGTLFGFYEKNLAGSLEQEGSHFVPSTRFGHAVNYSGALIKCLERGLEIQKALFPPKATDPIANFEINLHSVSSNVAEVTFDINGASHTYKNEPEEWLPVEWPAKDAKEQTSRVVVHGWSSADEEIMRPGEWGLFRLLDAAQKIEPGTEGGRRGGPPTIVVTWQLRTLNGSVKMDIRPSKDENAFVAYITKHQRLFKGYTCPRLISFGVR